jgi:hypothetical protein
MSAATPQSPERSRRRSIGLGTAFLVLAAILVPPALYRPTLHGKLPFSRDTLDEINSIRPDYVFIGNSMLATRIDEPTLHERLGKDCCYVLWTGGAESAWDHQALKNDVIAAEHRPKVVFVFFRDTYLTRVNYRTNDVYWWKIERVSHDSEPELLRAMRASRSWQERLEYDFGLLYPIQKRRETATYAIAWLASQMAAPGSAPYGEPVAVAYNDLFSLERFKGIEAADDAAADQDDAALYDFDAALPRSLLPSMVTLARHAGIQLVFVRVQRRPTVDGPPSQRPELVRYIARLKDYLAGNGAGFYDFTGDPELTLDHYMDGDHIRESWRAASTELFLRRLHRYFQ